MKQERYANWLYGYLLAQPLIDVLTAWMTRSLGWSITLGIVARGLFLLLLVAYTLFSRQVEKRRTAWVYFILLAVFGLVYIGFKPESWTLSRLLVEGTYFFKYFYFPVVLVCLWLSYRSLGLNGEKLFKVLAVNAVVTAFFIIVPFVTSTGFSSYVGQNKFGTVGWFYAANEIGAILTFLFPALYVLFYQKRYLYGALAGIFVGSSMMLLGTKVALLAAVIIEVMMWLWFLVRRAKKQLLVSTLLVVISLVTIPILPATKNVGISIDKYETQDEQERLEQEMLGENEPSSPSLLYKAVRVIFSGRQKFLSNTYQMYQAGGINDQLFGIGFVNRESIDNPKIEKLIEIDAADIVLRYGLVGGALYFWPLGLLLVRILKKGHYFLPYTYLGLLTIILGLGVSTIAGHVMGAPGVSTYLVLYLVILDQRPAKDEIG